MSEELVMLRDAAAGLLAEKAPVAELRRLRDSRDPQGYSLSLWREMSDMGWTGMAIPEAYGGLDYGYTGLGLVLEQMGRNLSVSPLQSSILVCATALVRMGSEAQKESLLPALAAGELTMALALQEGNHHAPEQTAMTATADGDTLVLQGRKCLVFDGHTADKLLVVVRTAGVPCDPDGLSLVIVDREAEGVAVERVIMLDSRNSATVSFDGVRVTADAVVGQRDQAAPGLEAVLDIANIGLSAELLGLSTEAFQRTMDYLKERKQFGAAIGSFQALQHRAAEMYAQLELARSIVIKALNAVDEGAEGISALASGCKAKLCEVSNLVACEAIQMHGGIGMTDEFDIGFFLKRARVAQHSYGDYNYHLDRFARLNGY
ncbi:MAG: acyl-CoA dehydrogenase family protein [Halieaceae bacterium]|nr:acyl-CoA dehydrogenase family protein [Halieaceae bacterium]